MEACGWMVFLSTVTVNALKVVKKINFNINSADDNRLYKPCKEHFHHQAACSAAMS